MPENIATLGIEVLSDDIIKATKRLDNLEDQSKKNTKQNKKMGQSFGALKAAVAAVGITLLTRALIGQINKYTALSNKLKLVTTDSENLATVQSMLFDVAQDTRASLEGTIDLYSRLARSTKDLGLSQNDLAEVTETVNKAIAVSGSTATEAQAALFQLGQGLAAGALRGEELNSVMEQTPRLAQAIAEGLGVGIAELREMGAAGELNAKRVIGALQAQTKVIDAEFQQTEKTISQAMQQISNVMLKTFGEISGGELVGALDELRKTLQDPDIVKGLQGMAKALVSLVTIHVKATSVLGTFFTNLTQSGENFGEMLANIGRTDLPFKLKQINKEIAIYERIQKNAALGSGTWKIATDNLTRSFKELKKVKEGLGISTKPVVEPKATKQDGKPDKATSDVFREDGAFGKAQEKELEKLRQRYGDEIMLLEEKFTEERALLAEKLASDASFQGEHDELLLAATQDYYTKLQEIKDEKGESLEQMAERLNEELEAKREHKALLLEIEMDYYDRLYNMQAGSQQAALDFADRIRDGDYKGALKHGALMLSNVAKTSKAMFNIQKAAALATAIAELPSAVISSFKNGGGYPWGLIPAGLMLATGLQQINSIKSSSFGGGGSVSRPRGGGGGGVGAPTGGGLPDGATAVPDGSERRVRTVNIQLEGTNFSRETVQELMVEIQNEYDDGTEFNVTT